MRLGAFVNESHVYFRPPLLLALVWFLWGLDVFVFSKTHINYAKALGFDRDKTLSPAAICTSAIVIVAVFSVCWLMYSLRWPFSDPLVIPGAMYIASLCALLVPLDVLNRRGREQLLQTIFRVFMPLPTGVLFAEVLVGDIMTSLSKALADMQVSVCVLLSHSFMGGPAVSSGPFDAEISAAAASSSSAHGLLRTSSTMLQSYEQSCADSWLRPLITSLPFLLRFRQCIVAYRATGQAFPHLVNASKYASAFPVIWISTFAHQFPSISGEGLRRTWLLAISFNSFFSFMWDVVMDWGLSSNEARYFLLRDRLLFMNDGRAAYTRVRADDSEMVDELERDVELAPTHSHLSLGRLKSKDSDSNLLDSLKSSQLGVPTGESSEEEHTIRGALPRSPVSGAQRPPSLLPRFDALEGGGTGIDADAAAGQGGTLYEVSVGSGLPSARQSADSWGSLARQYASALFSSAQPSRFKGALEARDAHIMPLLPSTPIFYYAAIVFNFLLRVLWSFKLSVHLQLTQEGLTFVLELCEVVRRAVWLIFRMEWETIQIEERRRLADSVDSDAEADDLADEGDELPVAPAIVKRHGSLPSLPQPSVPRTEPAEAAALPEELWLSSPAGRHEHKARQRTASDRIAPAST